MKYLKYNNINDEISYLGGLVYVLGLGYAVIGGSGHPDKKIPVAPLPDDLNTVTYSGLMGLLATNGASFQLGFMWFWDYKTVFLRLSHTNFEFLKWLCDIFDSDEFDFEGKQFKQVKASGSFQLSCLPSTLCFILWQHWNEQGIHILPVHFAQYFSIHTLAMWSMRNGQWTGQTFLIHVNRLNAEEKDLLISLIKEKLGYESYLTMQATKLAISNPAKLVQELKPLFHESQLHRLNKK